MKKINLKKILFAVGVYFIAYFTAVSYQSNFWGDLLAPFGGWVAFGILFAGYLKTDGDRLAKWSWLAYSAACLCWAVADTLWSIYNLILGWDPETSVLLSNLYAMTNIFLGIAVLIFGIYRFQKWNGIQLLLDIVSVSVSTFILIWIFFFHKSFIIVELIKNDGWIAPASIIIDVSILVAIATHWLSIRTGKTPLVTCITSVGVLLFILTDMYYYYIYFYDFYRANSLIDAFYVGSLLLIAIGRYCRISCLDSFKSDVVTKGYTNIGFKHNGLLLLICPALVLLFKGFILVDFAIYFLVILVYEILSSYVQTAISNEQMLKREQRINLFLEDSIAVHTKELADKNRELTETNEKLFFLSNQDVITKLYNRRYFIHALEEKIEHSVSPETVSLLYIDLDRFKIINDTYGHDIGDRVLSELAVRLTNWNNKNAVLARLGGDEFVFAFEGNYDYCGIEKMADEIIKCCAEPVQIDSYIFHITLSMGISIYPLDAQNASALMKNADMAMYQAKANCYNKCVAYSQVLNEKVHQKNEIEILLKKADFDKEFQVFYQPQFSIPDKHLVGMEALLRWKCPAKGFISPAEFIPIAEEIDYIIPIGQWVMKQAIRQIALWNNKYFTNLKMGINVSPRQLDNLNFIEELKSFMEDGLVDPSWVDIEITENVAMGGEYRIKQIDDLFKGMGVSISIDDFGTGYSSLSYLKLFPFDRIKIAKPLVDSISADGFDKQIVKAIVMLSKSIGIKTIAEGVETQEQLDILIDLGCEEIQGYLLGRPMPAQELENSLLEYSNLFKVKAMN